MPKWPKVLSESDVRAAADQWHGRGPSLASLVDYINRTFPHLRASLFKGSYQSSRHLYANVASFGKVRDATYLEVRDRRGHTLFSHNSAEAYQTNNDVARWIVRFMEGR